MILHNITIIIKSKYSFVFLIAHENKGVTIVPRNSQTSGGLLICGTTFGSYFLDPFSSRLIRCSKTLRKNIQLVISGLFPVIYQVNNDEIVAKLYSTYIALLNYSLLGQSRRKRVAHEFYETCHSITFYFMKKDSEPCCDTRTPQSIHTKDESKRGSAFAFIFGVN